MEKVDIEDEKKPSELKLSEGFFEARLDTKLGKEAEKTEFTTKGVNRKLDKKYDIKFTAGSELFSNILEFIHEIGYDVIMRFGLRRMHMYMVDVSNTHLVHVMFDKTEFAEYVVEGIDENSEKVIYLDTSLINDFEVNKDYPIDFYVDTKDEMKAYIANGKEIAWRRLNSMAATMNNTLQGYKESEIKLKSLLELEKYQKIVVNQGALKSVLRSVSKKTGRKDVNFLVIKLRKNEIGFEMESKDRGSSIVLSGEDVLVYPQKEDSLNINIDYFKKFNKLKLTYQCIMYINSDLPLVYETKLGAGRIGVYLIIAPRARE